ncbi:helix-turn-helix domain-containing protein [Streptomyces sp. NPDC048845]|uniref:helix-turn-helix domain-containing protein n=1 Tax=Streptomyces sp. NPDC048845 TaxID=3155390 RepID=UPI0034160FC0
MHGTTSRRQPRPRRKPLGPLPAELPGPVRDFVVALRALHEDIGLSLSDLESRLPVSRSTLSRYLRGQTLPDRRLLALWCALSGAEAHGRCTELTRLLTVAEDGPVAGPARGPGPGAGTETAAGAGPARGNAPGAGTGAEPAQWAAQEPPGPGAGQARTSVPGPGPGAGRAVAAGPAGAGTGTGTGTGAES